MKKKNAAHSYTRCLPARVENNFSAQFHSFHSNATFSHVPQDEPRHVELIHKCYFTDDKHSTKQENINT